MANQEHLKVLKQGRDTWNAWRRLHSDIEANLTNADLSYANLSHANLSHANLSRTNLSHADLFRADLSRADLYGADLCRTECLGADLTNANLSYANLSHANLNQANLSQASLRGADLRGTNLSQANLSQADLINTNLSYANLFSVNLSQANLINTNLNYAMVVHTNFTDATLLDCHMYGISAGGLQLQGATQNNLVITPYGESMITVDHLEVAQFISLWLNNPHIRDVIDTIAKKAVLILGRCTDERKAVFDALRDELREHNYVPILLDFNGPHSRDVAESIRTLAHLARFILADLSSIPLELQAIVPDLEVPVQPLLSETKKDFSTFDNLRKYPWVLPTYTYQDLPSLLSSLKHLLASAEHKAEELAIERARRLTSP